MGDMAKAELRDQIAELRTALAETEARRLAANSEVEVVTGLLRDERGDADDLRERLAEAQSEAGLLRLTVVQRTQERDEALELMTEYADELGAAMLLRHYPEVTRRAMDLGQRVAE